MKEYITGQILANEIRMKRSVDDFTFFLLEGVSDYKLFNRFVDSENCKIRVTNGFQNALDAVDVLNSNSIVGVVALIDADFRNVTGESVPANVLTTDLHDVECMLLLSPALDHTLTEYANETRVAELGVIATTAAVPMQPLGCFRLVSYMDKLDLTFKTVEVSNFFEVESMRVNLRAMIQDVKNKSQQHGVDENKCVKRIEQEMAKAHPLWQIVNGHDVLKCLSILLRKKLSGKSSGAVSPKELERALRIGYERAYFESTELFARLSAWEHMNQNYPVLLR